MESSALTFWFRHIDRTVKELFKSKGAVICTTTDEIRSMVLDHDPDMKGCPEAAWSRLQDALTHAGIQRRNLPEGRMVFYRPDLTHIEAIEMVGESLPPTMVVFSAV